LQKWLAIEDEFVTDFADAFKQTLQSELFAFWALVVKEMSVRLTPIDE
jgi:hypothetical protein